MGRPRPALARCCCLAGRAKAQRRQPDGKPCSKHPTSPALLPRHLRGPAHLPAATWPREQTAGRMVHLSGGPGQCEAIASPRHELSAEEPRARALGGGSAHSPRRLKTTTAHTAGPQTRSSAPTGLGLRRGGGFSLARVLPQNVSPTLLFKQLQKPMHNATASENPGITERETQVSPHSCNTQGLATKRTRCFKSPVFVGGKPLLSQDLLQPRAARHMLRRARGRGGGASGLARVRPGVTVTTAISDPGAAGCRERTEAHTREAGERPSHVARNTGRPQRHEEVHRTYFTCEALVPSKGSTHRSTREPPSNAPLF